MRPRHLLLLLLLLLATPVLADKSYRVPAVQITADLADDGSMQVHEERTYRFKGRFKYAYRTFALDERITYRDFRVSENGRPFTLSDSEEPGTYRVTQEDDQIEVRWFYRGRNESRTFAIDYLVQDAVHRHRDAAVLYYKFIGEGFSKKTGQVDITVNPPAPVEDWKVRQWAHGPLWAESATSADGVVTATCTKLPRRRFFELRILYPPELFPAAFERAGYISATVTEEEAAWAEEANARRLRAIEGARKLKERQGMALWALPVVVFLVWAYFMRLWREQKSTYPDQPSLDVSTLNPPDDVPPALVSYLLNSRTVAATSLMATLMDLGRRGFVAFREEYVAKQNLLGKEKWEAQHRWELNEDHLAAHRQELEPFEEHLLEFVFEKMPGQKTRVVDVEMFKKKKSKVRSFFGQWSSRIKKEGKRRNWFAEDSFKARNKGIWMGVGLSALGVVMLFVTHAVGLMALVPGLILVAAATAMVRPTAEGARQISRFKGLRRHLKKGSFRQDDPIGTYFIYGVLFGMSKDRMKDLGGMAGAGQNPMAWYYPAHGHQGGDFGASFATAVTAVNSAMSSSTGSGGGASGGGGGGAGGGGGGAG